MERGTLDDLAAFAAVAHARSFTRAAPGLGLSVSALSYAIKRLERRLGTRLLQRNSRSVASTSAGARLLETLGPALGDVEQALQELDRDRSSVTGIVRITATRQGYEAVIRPVLGEFAERHPGARIEVLIEYEFRDIIAASLDAGIRMGEKLEQDMIAVSVSPPLRMAVIASPAYLSGRKAPDEPGDLRHHPCIRYRMRANGSVIPWEFDRDGRTVAVDVTGPLTINEPELAVDAALDGLGLAYVLEDRAAPHIAAGRLVRLLEDWTQPFPGFFLYYPSRRQLQPTLAALVNILRQRARTLS
ncbi:MAG: LysR family transcriptional regulator [Janthinobacterium lividum]